MCWLKVTGKTRFALKACFVLITDPLQEDVNPRSYFADYSHKMSSNIKHHIPQKTMVHFAD